MIEFSLQKKLHAANGNLHLNINCSIQNGEFISLYGASGAGKTSVLRMLAGFLKPDDGFIKMNDETWFDQKRNMDVKPQHRKTGFVFQDDALFPNMNVRENITYALSKHDSKNIVDDVMQLTGTTPFAGRKIQTLSGGQKQRVALARAIARKPSLLLLDEPLSAIDDSMRLQLQTTLAEVHRQLNLTTILVSHDADEILKLSDKIIFLNNGIAEEYAGPSQFFLKANHSTGITATVLSTHQNSLVMLMNNRMIEIPSEHFGDLIEGDKIELIFKDAVPLIRKL